MPIPRWQTRWRILACVLAVMALGAGLAFVYFGHVTLRVAVGPAGSDGQRFMAAFIPLFAAERPRIRLQSFTTDDLTESAKAIDDGRADLAIVRDDIATPKHGSTIAILRRDAVVLIAPAHSGIEKVADLKGKAIGVFPGPSHDSRLLDLILGYYNVPADVVRRVMLTQAEIGPAIRQKRVAAIFVVGPIGSGRVADVLSAAAKAGKGAPDLLAVDDAEAIAKRYPVLDSVEVPQGAFQGNPSIPDESTTVLVVTYRLVARNAMLNWTAAEITRLLFLNKAKLAAALPYLNQLEAPDTDDKTSTVSLHPGAAAYLNGEQKGPMEQVESIFWTGSMLASLIGALYAGVRGFLRTPKDDRERERADRLVAALRKIRSAGLEELDAFEDQLDRSLEAFLQQHKAGVIGNEEFQSISLALNQARQAIETRRSILRGAASSAGKPAEV